MGRAPGEDDHVTLGVDLHLSTFEWADTCSFDVGAQAIPRWIPCARNCAWVAPVLVVPDKFQQALEGGWKAACVVDDLMAGLDTACHAIRLLFIRDEVAPDDVGGVEAQLLGDRVDDPVHDKRRLWAPRARYGRLNILCVRTHSASIAKFGIRYMLRKCEATL